MKKWEVKQARLNKMELVAYILLHDDFNEVEIEVGLEIYAQEGANEADEKNNFLNWAERNRKRHS